MFFWFFFLYSFCAEIDDITLISAFFDIGRGNSENFVRTRSKDDYLAFFKKWARIKNHLIVFCQDNTTKNEILTIRKDFGLVNETEVIVVDDIFLVEKDMYDRMVEVSENAHFLRLREGDDNIPENTAKYCYVTNLKSYFLYYANLECEIKTENIAWIDFGYNHGGKSLENEMDWSFNLKCNTSSKVTLFYRGESVDERPLFEIIRSVQPESITGGLIVCPKILVNDFWALTKDSIYSLLCIGFEDDDQTVFLLVSRRRPEMFEVKRETYWFLGIKEHCNGGHMRLSKRAKGKSINAKRMFERKKEKR